MGYRLNDQDIETVVRWLKIHHPERATKEFATALLTELKLTYRRVGWEDPDKLEDFYSEFTDKQRNITA